MKFRSAIVSLFVAVLFVPSGAWCVDRSTQEILEELQTLKDQAGKMQERMDKLEQELKDRDQEIAEIKQETTKTERGVVSKVKDRLSLSGDFRIRYEGTFNQDELEDRHRGVLRGRFNAAYKINDMLKTGMQLATGSAGDPNSTDVTMGNFVDDFDVNLTKLYMDLTYRDIFLTGGKFANPFLTTELVWDGDVNPQGVAGSYTFPQFKKITPKLTGMYFIVNEDAAASDSDMFGGQASVKITPSEPWTITLGGAYYDYYIPRLTNADSGDIASNNLNPARTAYLSDFDLLDAVAAVQYSGLSKRFPLTLVADYVKNLGARVNADEGFSVDLFVGNAAKKGDLRFRYGYSVAETDAVIAAFSHDNTTFPTNYRQHTLSADYVVLDNTFLNLTWYVYRRDELGTTPETDSDDYVSRLRLNAVLAF